MDMKRLTIPLLLFGGLLSLQAKEISTELPTKKWTNFLSPYAAILNLLIIN